MTLPPTDLGLNTKRQVDTRLSLSKVLSAFKTREMALELARDQLAAIEGMEHATQLTEARLNELRIIRALTTPT